MAAAGGAGQSGAPAVTCNLGAGLATTQRDVQVGNAGLLNHIGSTIRTVTSVYWTTLSGRSTPTAASCRARRRRQARRRSRTRCRRAWGWPHGRRHVPARWRQGAAWSADEARLRSRRSGPRRVAGQGRADRPRAWRPGQVLGSGMTNMDMANTSRVMPGMMGGGGCPRRMPTPLPGRMGGIRAGDPMLAQAAGGRWYQRGRPGSRGGRCRPTAPRPDGVRRPTGRHQRRPRNAPQLPALRHAVQRSPLLPVSPTAA